jgi:hypothetical protein
MVLLSHGSQSVIHFLKIVTNTHQAEFTSDLFDSSQERLPVSEIVFEAPTSFEERSFGP